MRSQPPWDDDPLRRWFIERAPPLTWRSIAGWALAAVGGVTLGLSRPGGAWEVLALVLAVVGALEVLRGVLRMVLLGLGGSDQPLRTYLRKRLEG
jgi:hypothetical protein